MTVSKKVLARRFVLVAGMACLATSLASAGTFFSVGTGAVDGTYYPVGRALCDIVNQAEGPDGNRCSVESTPGSVYNVGRLVTGELEFAIVQSDVQFAAYQGKGEWDGRPMGKLRSVVSLFPELVTIIANADENIAELDDLKGKRLNPGAAGSGSRATFETVARSLGWTGDDLVHLMTMKPDVATIARCDRQVSANFLLVGHPSRSVQQELAACPSVVADATGPAIDKLTAEFPYFRKGVIPATTYGLDHDVRTFGVSATLMTTSDVDEEVVYRLTKTIVTNLATLKASHPVLQGLDLAAMTKDSLTAPLHPGAERALRELGAIN